MYKKLAQILKKHKIRPRGAIHVGAHLGEEVKHYKAAKFSNIILFEANPACCKVLRKIPNVEVINAVVCDKNGKIDFNIAMNTQHSSMFDVNPKAGYDKIKYVKSVKIRSLTLDDAVKDHSSFNFLGIDVQGAEPLVLNGASRLLKNIDLLLIEMQYVEIYSGTPLYKELDQQIVGFGFKRVGKKVSGSGDWADVIYKKIKS